MFIVFAAFAHLRFYTKMLYFESLRVAKSDFGIKVLTFRACQGNLSHFSDKVFLPLSDRSKRLFAHGFQVLLVLSLKVQ